MDHPVPLRPRIAALLLVAALAAGGGYALFGHGSSSAGPRHDGGANTAPTYWTTYCIVNTSPGTASGPPPADVEPPDC
jgi:hypothetical protein